MNCPQQYNKGFSLVEVFVAVIIFSFTIVAFMGVLTKGISATNNQVRKDVAIYLAQQGIELVEYIRDQNFLAGNNWTDSILPQCQEKCYVSFGADASQVSLIACAQECPTITKDSSGFYKDTHPTAGAYRRSITVTPIGDTGTDVIRITSKVEWGNSSRSVKVEKIMSNWYASGS